MSDLQFQGLADAAAAGRWFAQRTRHRDLQLRRSFVQGREGKSELPPLVRLMRGGRGGEVRLKLLLSLLWVGAKPPHDVSLPARAWAELLGLPNPRGQGGRRIREATDWLVEHRYLAREQRPGLPSVLVLRREDGSGVPYTVPGFSATAAVEKGRGLAAHRYVRVPPEMWSNAWIATLSASGIAAFLILLAEQRSASIEQVWLAPALAHSRYRLAHQTRYRGLNELERLGLAKKERLRVGNGHPDAYRQRNGYTLLMEGLRSPRADLLAEPSGLTPDEDF